MKHLNIFIFSMLFLAVACDKNDKPKETATVETSTVKKQADSLNQQVTAAWDTMIKADDQKFADIKRLLEEVSYTNNHDPNVFQELLKQTQAVKASRYTMETMNNESITKYDNATDSLIARVMAFKAKTKGVDRLPTADKLTEDINKANVDDLIRFRREYDAAAESFNVYFDKNQEELKKAGEPYASMKKKPLFNPYANQPV